MLSQYSMMEHWLANQLETARYAHVPVGNLPADYPTAVLDIFFARALRKHNHLLWVSPSSRPDLGGREDDDNRLMTEIEEDTGLHINEPGVYKTICVQMDIARFIAHFCLYCIVPALQDHVQTAAHIFVCFPYFPPA